MQAAGCIAARQAHFITVAQILASLEAGWMTGKQRNMWRALQCMG